jgi:hypothetical protein
MYEIYVWRGIHCLKLHRLQLDNSTLLWWNENVRFLCNFLPQYAPHDPLSRINPRRQITLTNLLLEFTSQSLIFRRRRTNQNLTDCPDIIRSQNFGSSLNCIWHNSGLTTVGLNDAQEGSVWGQSAWDVDLMIFEELSMIFTSSSDWLVECKVIFLLVLTVAERI